MKFNLKKPFRFVFFFLLILIKKKNEMNNYRSLIMYAKDKSGKSDSIGMFFK